MIFYLFDRWGVQIRTLTDIISASHTDEINGEDSLTIEIYGSDLIKGQRIVWRDKFGTWHEHTISDLSVTHSEGIVITKAYCENSISELLTDYIVEREPTGVVSALLSRALDGTRWSIGTVNALGSYHTSWYHISVYEAICDIVKLCGGELQTDITVSGAQVTSRKVSILSRRGRSTDKYFAYGLNLSSVQRIVDPDDVYTALYGYGKGIPLYDEDGESTGGYSRKITFGEVNGGVNWIGDDDAKQKWGLPDGKGGTKHTFGQVEFSGCEDPNELLALTKEALKEYSVPRVRYEGTVLSLGQGGFLNGEDSITGDTVFLRDKQLDERLSGRVVKVVRDLFDDFNTSVTLGNLARTFSGSTNAQLADLDVIKNKSTNWDESANAGKSWLDHMIDRLNQEFSIGGSYKYESFEIGTIYSSVPLDKNFKPTKTPAMAFQLNGGGFRIANTVDSSGNFEWRTFGNGDGFTADCINVGVIRGGSNYWNLETGDLMFEQGGIRDSKGNNYWNLDTGEFRLSASSTKVGDKSFSDYISDQIPDIDVSSAVDDALTQEKIFNKLTNGGTTQGIYLEGDKLYINGTYVRTGIITSSGGSHWNLNSGEFETICTLSSTQTSNTTTYTRYTDSVIVVDMTASIPFQISSGTRIRTVYKNGQDTEYGDVTSKTFIGGIETSGTEVYFRASRVGVSSTNYITTGRTTDGYIGASFMNDGAEYFRISSMKETGSSGSNEGAGFSTTGGKWFLYTNGVKQTLYLFRPITGGASTGNISRGVILTPNGTWIQNSVERYMVTSDDVVGVFWGSNNSGLYIDSSVLNLQWGNTQNYKGLFMGWSSVAFQESKDKYLYINQGTGDMGFRWGSSSGLIMTNSAYWLAWSDYCYIRLASGVIEFCAGGNSAYWSNGRWS